MITFPLVLSCGHGSVERCTCTPARTYKNDNGPSPVDIAHSNHLGRWRETIEGFGFRLPPHKKHGPCPVCGGKDRFRFKDRDGRGSWLCNQCDPKTGGGLLLLSRCLGLSVMDTAKKLNGDDVTATPRAPIKIINHDAARAAGIESAKKSAALLMSGAVLRDHEYMRKKGLFGEWPTNGEPMAATSGEIIPVGARLFVPAYKNGELVNVQRISTDGEKRPIYGGDMQGVYHKIDGPSSIVGVCEGFATGVTINRLTGGTIYCAFNTGNLASVSQYVKSQHEGKRIIFFADHDELDKKHGWRAGEHFAELAAAPVGGVVALPPDLGDWDDYRQKHGDNATKEAMRTAIKCYTAKMEPPPAQPIAPAKTPTQAPKLQPQTQSNAKTPPTVPLDDYNIDNPPGLAGEIVDYMRSGANRVLTGGAYAGMALQCMAMAGAGLHGFKSVKLSLITITLGVSASGKEHPQRVIKSILEPHNKTIYGDIRSDKDVIRSAIYDNGHCFYLVDEAQKIFPNSNQNKHMGNVVNTLMELSTTGCYKLSQLHRDEFLSDIETKKARAEKMLAAKKEAAEAFNPQIDAIAIKRNEQDVKFYEQKVAAFDARTYTAINGVKNPALHLVAYSTPQKLAAIVDEDSIESGLLGRALIFDCGAERAVSKIDFDDDSDSTGVEQKTNPRLEYLRAQIGLICQLAGDVAGHKTEFEDGAVAAAVMFGGGFKYQTTPEALEDLRAIAAHYDQYAFRNHVRAGAIYARLVERVLSLCSIMSLGNIDGSTAVITRDYVRYALLLVLSSIDHLMGNLRINEGATEKTIEAKIEAVKEAIVKRLTVDKFDALDGWRYKSQIKDYMKRRQFFITIQEACQKENQDAFENALASLGGRIERSDDGSRIRLKPA